MKRIFVIFAIILGVYLLFFSNFSFSGLLFGEDEQQAHVTNKIDTIEIDVAGATTTVIPEERDNVEAVVDGKGKVTVKESGDSITVEYSRKWYENFGFFTSSTLDIYIPEDYSKDMNINIGSGSVDYAGKSQKQPLKLNHLSLNMGSGQASLKNFDLGQYEQQTGSGSVRIDSLSAEKGTFEISSGETELTNYTGEIEADLSSGQFHVQMDQLADAIKIDVSSGEANLDLPDDADFKLKGEVSSGNIDCNFQLKNQEQDKNGIEGTHGSGKHEINLDVSSGDINIF
ncbi:hypothetical protein CU633_00725 [Bacillus sp. V3-13]|uniref:LiaG family protein n=1 Tax=Bacillus sp. V3-13 TaxID=2053728 RepID=UPI000C777208|nr:DUF4097 domain-containing protein [Bacillus sp. V3-13]PLR79288.1 hypothetical protein CU633_00725 [Bacillus sp. V3-13]